MDEANVIYSEVSNEPIGFVSTWKSTRSTNSTSVGTDPNPPALKTEMSTETTKHCGTSTQTEVQTTGNKCDDLALANWLNKIYPFVEEELNLGMTTVYDWYASDTNKMRLQKHQILSLKESAEITEAHAYSTAIWLSVQTQLAPTLAVSYYPNHSTWCDHSDNAIKIYSPKREANGSLLYTKINEIPVKSCVSVLATNPYNKDIFAGGTVSGDLYVWQYHPSTNTVTEHFNEAFNQAAIVGIVWIKFSTLNSEYAFLTCHVDGHICLWKYGAQIVNERIFRIISRNRKSEALNLSSITALSGLEFVVGTEEGQLFLCSASQLLPVRQAKNIFDPVIIELEPHKFGISSMALTSMNDKPFLVTCDTSGEVYVHDIGDSKANEPSVIIKMPLPFKNKIVCTRDLKYILSPGSDGALEMYNIGTGEKDTIDGGLNGKGNMISMADNGNWIATGTYSGELVVFKTVTD